MKEAGKVREGHRRKVHAGEAPVAAGLQARLLSLWT